MSVHYRTIAGNLEYFLAAYLIDFGILGLLFFLRFDSRDGRFGSAAAIVLGILLMVRARRMLAWHTAFFWIVTTLAIVVPVGILLPAMIRWWR
jgi:hypothetical protein